MKYQNQTTNQNSNQMIKLVSIFSVLFASAFFVTFLLSENKDILSAKAMIEVPAPSHETSMTTVSESGLKDPATYSHISAEEPKTTKQSGTSSSISNYVNAWKLSKVTLGSQIIV